MIGVDVATGTNSVKSLLSLESVNGFVTKPNTVIHNKNNEIVTDIEEKTKIITTFFILV